MKVEVKRAGDWLEFANEGGAMFYDIRLDEFQETHLREEWWRHLAGKIWWPGVRSRVREIVRKYLEAGK